MFRGRKQNPRTAIGAKIRMFFPSAFHRFSLASARNTGHGLALDALAREISRGNFCTLNFFGASCRKLFRTFAPRTLPRFHRHFSGGPRAKGGDLAREFGSPKERVDAPRFPTRHAPSEAIGFRYFAAGAGAVFALLAGQPAHAVANASTSTEPRRRQQVLRHVFAAKSISCSSSIRPRSSCIAPAESFVAATDAL